MASGEAGLRPPLHDAPDGGDRRLRWPLVFGPARLETAPTWSHSWSLLRPIQAYSRPRRAPATTAPACSSPLRRFRDADSQGGDTGSNPVGAATPLKVQFRGNQPHIGGRDGRPLAPSTVHKVYAVPSLVFAQAVRWEWVARNPVTSATPRKVRRGEPAAPEAAAVRKLMATAAAEQDPSLEVYLRLVATAGRRRGEISGLQWERLTSATGGCASSGW